MVSHGCGESGPFKNTFLRTYAYAQPRARTAPNATPPAHASAWPYQPLKLPGAVTLTRGGAGGAHLTVHGAALAHGHWPWQRSPAPTPPIHRRSRTHIPYVTCNYHAIHHTCGRCVRPEELAPTDGVQTEKAR